MEATDRSPLRVVGRYAIYNEIAAGGMATIHLGRLLGPVGFARTVAVKRLHPQFAKDPEFVSGFLDEARLAARVQHPNVVATIDVVATEGELFLIMDYVRGESLSRLLRVLRQADQRVPPRIAASIMCGFLHGLHSAHEAKNERGEPLGLVHRDVSPQNVLVGADGIPRVLDFGIAKAQGRIQVTRDGQIKGKLAYMPPEQLAGKELSRKVDIYASAVVMWETLTTERLFKGDTEAETLQKILRDPVTPPSSFGPGLEAFDAPLLRALSREPSKRQATAKELALSLERCVGIASPTEVGEWVEALVGPVLGAREQQIAEIESSSASLRLKEELAGRLDDSGSDRVPPSSHAVFAANAALEARLRGGGSSTALRADPEELPTKILGTPTPRREATERSEVMGTRTGTAFMLPVDRRFAVMASIAGVAVLAVIVAIVLAGPFSSPKRTADPAASPSEAASSEPPAAVLPVFDAGTSEIASSDVPTEPPPPPEPPRSKPLAAPHPRLGPAVAQGVGQTTTSKPAPAPPSPGGTASPGAKSKNCDPPYTLDAQGRRKYKLECM